MSESLTFGTEWYGDGDRCPACGEFPSYCQGHGEIGDPEGRDVIERHDDGHHDYCHPFADCQEEYEDSEPFYPFMDMNEAARGGMEH